MDCHRVHLQSDSRAPTGRLPEERWKDIEDFARQITAENKKEEQD